METDGELLQRLGTNGKLWAEEFCKRFPECKKEDVLSWFCNAIEAGRDAGINNLLKNMD
jgi:hypothetical protein